MSFLDRLEAEPWRFDYFVVMRQMERAFSKMPRIGDSAVRREEFVHLGQDPFMAFPASNLARVRSAEAKPLKVFVSSWACLVPQGALPLSTTEEAYH